MTRWLSELEQRTWRTFLEASTRLVEECDQSLQRRSGLALTDYEILVMLSEAPDGRLRMNELAERVLVSRSRLTYRVDGLAQRGLVDREQAEDDRRGLYATLTSRGLATLVEAAPGHVEDVRRILFDHLEPDEIEVILRNLVRVKNGLVDGTYDLRTG